jgi:hypothetical protein
MGAGNSTLITEKVVTNVLSQVIAATLQSASNDVELGQVIIVDCDNFTKIIVKAHEKCRTEFKNTPELIPKICGIYDLSVIGCGITNLVWKQAIRVTTDDKFTSDANLKLANVVKVNLTTKLQEASGFLQFGNKVKADIDALSEAVAGIDARVYQTAFTNSTLKQSLKLNGGFVELIDLEQSVDIISKVVLENKTVVELSQQLAVDLQLEVVANSPKTLQILKWVGIAVGSVVVIVVVSFLLRFLIQRFGRRRQRLRAADIRPVTIELQAIQK